MIDKKVKVKVLGEERLVSEDATFEDLAKEYEDKFAYPIIMARENFTYHELDDKIEGNSDIEFYDLSNREANRIYFNGLIFLVIYAIKELYGKNTIVFVRHTIDKGLYIEVNKPLTKEMIKNIKDKMQQTVKEDRKISRLTVDRIEAIEYFEKIGDKTKAGILKYNINTYITLYKLGNIYDFFFSKMPNSTSKLGIFDLVYLNEHGFILMYPSHYFPDKIGKYVHHPKMFEIFNEYHEWAKIMKVENVTDLNQILSRGNIGTLMRVDETIQSNKLLNIAREIHRKRDKIKIILIAGPSSSGKTTTSLKLINYLRSFGLRPKKVSMDDYFIARKDTPRKEDGSYDYECLEAVDVEMFNDHIDKLLSGKEVLVPTYNFIKGIPEFLRKESLEKNELLIIEGIHALNPKILENIPKSKKFKIYISPMTGINIDNHNRISTSDNRLLRRIVRDNRTRGNSVEDTIARWPSVREGEEKYIFPYQDEADVIFNTALLYELGVLKTYVEPLLYSIDPRSEYYVEAKRLLNMLKIFLPMPSEEIPADSLIREFIGGSCFKVD